MDIQFLNELNTFFWIMSNLFILYIGIVLMVFVAGYAILFDPRATTAGRFVFRFATSLLGVMGLVFIGIFINPTTPGSSWLVYPGDIFVWRPLIRAVVYGFVAYTVTGLAVLVILRKWWPHKLRTARDAELIRPRTDTISVVTKLLKGEK